VKADWKKDEKDFYLPKAGPRLVRLPAFRFLVIDGEGNPNGEDFASRVATLYSLAYGVRMSPKAGIAPAGYAEYAVYPLEGLWDLSEEAKRANNGFLNKDDLAYSLMIRQPDFVDGAFVSLLIGRARGKQPGTLLDAVRFESAEEGECVQMIHVGSYDDEPASFAVMEAFAAAEGFARSSLRHREIYLSDPRKTEPGKRRTLLRFQVSRLAGLT